MEQVEDALIHAAAIRISLGFEYADSVKVVERNGCYRVLFQSAWSSERDLTDLAPAKAAVLVRDAIRHACDEWSSRLKKTVGAVDRCDIPALQSTSEFSGFLASHLKRRLG